VDDFRAKSVKKTEKHEMFLNRLNNVKCEEKEKQEKVRRRLVKEDDKLTAVE